MTKIVKPLAWNTTMDRLEKVLRDLPEDRRDLFQAGLIDGTLSPDDSHKGATPMEDANKQALLTIFSQLVGEHGNRPDKWRIVAETLNERGVTTPKGKAWDKDNVRKYWARNSNDATVPSVTFAPELPPPDLVSSSPDVTQKVSQDFTNTAGAADQEEPPLEANGEKTTQGLPVWLDDAAWEDLEQLLKWWRSQHGKPASTPRPVFRGKRRNTGVHANEEILVRAAQKARTEKAMTGGSLSLLVEWLLWQYVGSPDDLLES